MCSVSRRAGETAPARSPTRSTASAPPRSRRGSSPWCSKAGAPSRVASGWATHSCTAWSARAVPGSSSACATPPPAVMRFSCPGLIGCSEPRLSRCTSSPGEQPGHGLEAHVRVRADAQRAGPLPGHRAHVIGEAPGPDGAARPLRQHAAHRQRADLRRPPGRNLHDRTGGAGVVPGRCGRVVGGDRAAHDLIPTPIGWRRTTTTGGFAMTTPDDADVVDEVAESRFVIRDERRHRSRAALPRPGRPARR